MANTDKFDYIVSNAGYTRVLDYVDLFDEGRFGADKLFLRGSFSTLSAVSEQVKAFLTTKDSPEPKDEDEYISPFSDPNVAREIADHNRLFDPNRKIWKLSDPDPNDCYPQKATYRLLFFVKLHFNLDFAYIWFGIPWDESGFDLSDPEAELNSIEDIALDDLRVLRHTWISREDAEMVLDKIKGKEGVDTQMLNMYSMLSDTNISI